VASAVLAASTWSVLALTLHIELFTLEHYLRSIEPQADTSPLFKDVFLFHWKEESQHAILDELELRREDLKLTDADRDRAVDELIGLVQAVDGILQAQAAADAEYFTAHAAPRLAAARAVALAAAILKAYRGQYIVSGVKGRFVEVLKELLSEAQLARIVSALTPVVEAATPVAVAR
jgi:hypothetical protein